MKLFLSSNGIPGQYRKQFCKLVGKDFKDMTIVYIPTAADPYPLKWFVDATRDELTSLGVNLIELDLKNYVGKREQLEHDLGNGDVVYCSGGNSFCLNYWMKKVDFKNIMLKLLEKGCVYSGESAGAVVAGSSIEPLEFLDEPEAAPERIDKGMGFVDSVILPHWGIEKYAGAYAQLMKKYGHDKNFKFIKLANEEAVVVDK